MTSPRDCRTWPSGNVRSSVESVSPSKAREDSRTPRRSRGIEDQFPRCSRCNARSPHRGHFSTVAVRGSPAVPHRTPPASQTDCSKPQEHRSIHDLDSSSMASAMRRGRIRSRNLCRRLTLEAVYASRRSELMNRFQSSKRSPFQSFWHSHASKPTTTPTGSPILRITLHPFNSSTHSTCPSTPTAPAPGGLSGSSPPVRARRTSGQTRPE